MKIQDVPRRTVIPRSSGRLRAGGPFSRKLVKTNGVQLSLFGTLQAFHGEEQWTR